MGFTLNHNLPDGCRHRHWCIRLAYGNSPAAVKHGKKEKEKEKNDFFFLKFLFYFIKLLWINDENRPIPAWGPAKNRAKYYGGGGGCERKTELNTGSI